MAHIEVYISHGLRELTIHGVRYAGDLKGFKAAWSRWQKAAERERAGGWSL